MPQKYAPRETELLGVGDRARFFDAIAWNRVGDVGDNDRFYRPATIVRIYRDERDILTRLVDIRFDHRDVVSKGHFLEPGYQRPLKE